MRATPRMMRKSENPKKQLCRNERKPRTSKWRNPTNSITYPGGSTGSFRSSRMTNLSTQQPFRTAQNTIQQSQCLACGGFGHLRANCRANLTFQRQSRIYVNPSMFPGSQPQPQQQQETGR